EGGIQTTQFPAASSYPATDSGATTGSEGRKEAEKMPTVLQYVMILVNSGVPIAFAGTEEPAAYGELISIGGLGPSVNGKLSATIAEILETKLSIDSSRFYIKFYDVQVKPKSLTLLKFQSWFLLLALRIAFLELKQSSANNRLCR
ncbi:unnamed protein product, partial [Linum tenue]